jgi:ATP-dependent Lon protease
VTLRGRVLPIGGLKEKALAALRVGIPHVIIPEQNKKELVEIPEDIRRRMKFHPVKDMDDVIGLAFKKPEKAKRRKTRRAAA